MWKQMVCIGILEKECYLGKGEHDIKEKVKSLKKLNQYRKKRKKLKKRRKDGRKGRGEEKEGKKEARVAYLTFELPST